MSAVSFPECGSLSDSEDSEELRSSDRDSTTPITKDNDTKDVDYTAKRSLECVKYEDYVLNNIRSLVHDSRLNDVVFVVENCELHGIRSLFASQSIVFRQMLYGSMMESFSGNYVILNDITLSAFKYLRNTFYNIFDNKLSSSIVVDVLFAAQKYLINPLVTKCLNFIRNITHLNDWFIVLNKFESSSFQLQSSIYLNSILNEGFTPYILQYKSLSFVKDDRFKYLKRESIIILINSDYLAAKEDDIWESLLRWTRFNNELMDGFIKYIRFNQMDAMYFKQNIVDKMVLPRHDIINIMFARENGTKWKSSFNDCERIKSKTMDTFELNEVCLSLSLISQLKVGDLIDFRDFYGLFCPSSIIDCDHNENKIKIHYNSWGSTYDEWYNYLAQNHINNDDDDMVELNQTDKNSRIAKYGSITSRKIKREYFRKEIEEFTNNNLQSLNHDVQVKLPNWFWKKNESYIDNKHLYKEKWLNAKIIGYKSATKYSDHIKIGVYIHDDHFEYWLHPDNVKEIRPITK